MYKLLGKIESTDRRYKLFSRNDRILIALSGGPDSVALFHLLYHLAPKYNLSLAAAHVNHCLRRESDDEHKFCQTLCRVHGVKFHSKKYDISALAKRHKVGLEQAGRRSRYAFFQTLCNKFSYTKIATGHTADDSAETLLLNLIRGSHLGGLSGIPPQRQNIIRPLIEITKSDIIKFIRDNRLSYRLDLSNLSDDYNRNIIRNKVFPILQKINSRALRNISKASLNIRQSAEFIEYEVEEIYNKCLIDESNTQIILDLRKLPSYYKSLESWVLLKAYFRLTGEFKSPGSNRIMQTLALDRTGAAAFLDAGVVVFYHSGRLILCRPPVRIRRISLVRGETVRLGKSDLTISAEIVGYVNWSQIKTNDDESVAYLDNDKPGSLIVRGLKQGDKFSPLGMKGTKKVVDYLNEKGVSRINKSSIPIVTSGPDIVWIAGYGIADKFKVTQKTEQVLKLQLTGRM